MLVITRKIDECIVIYDEDGGEVARVVLVKSMQGKAQLGVSAPSHVKILRSELIEGVDEPAGMVAPHRSYA